MLQEVGAKKIFSKYFEMAERVVLIIHIYMQQLFHDNMMQLLLLASLFKKPQMPKEFFIVLLSLNKKKKMKQPGDHFEFLWQIYALRTVNHQPQLSLEIMQKEEKR